MQNFNLKAHLKSLLSCLILILCSCQSKAEHLLIPAQAHPLMVGEALYLNVPHGSVDIQFTTRQDLQIAGSIHSAELEGLTVNRISEGQRIDFTPQGRHPDPIQLRLSLPESTDLIFETFDATLTLSGVGGEIDVTTISGDVQLEGFSGIAVIKANRGDVWVKASIGAISVFANYGNVHFDDSHGQITVVNILGEIVYRGQPESDDAFNLQTDHGPVDFSVPADANLTVSIQSTSGAVVCLPPNLVITTRTCIGDLGVGGASLVVQTVSGGVKLWIDYLHE